MSVVAVASRGPAGAGPSAHELDMLKIIPAPGSGSWLLSALGRYA